MSNKIRIFLIILTFAFIATAITINNTVHDNDVLNIDSKALAKNLHDKEDIVDEIFADTLQLKTFANSERYPLQIREISKEYQEKSVYLFLYKKDKPIFWSTNVYVPETAKGLKNDISYITSENRSFIVKRKLINDEITLLAIITVKRFFKSNNEFLNPGLFNGLVHSDNLEIADFSDSQNIKNIYSKDNTYLFSVKLKTGLHKTIFVKIQLLCWILATLTFFILIQGICIDMARKGYAWQSVLLLITTFILVRIFDLDTNWLAENSSLEIFDSRNYTYSFFTPNLWSFIVNSIGILWVVSYCLYIKDKLLIPNTVNNKPSGILIFYGLLCILYAGYAWVFHYLGTLVTNSTIADYNFIEIIKTHPFSFYFILVYCVNILSLILLTDFVLHIGKSTCDRSPYNLNVQLFTLVQFLIIGAFADNFDLTYLLIGVIILVRSFDRSMLRDNNISTHVISIVTLALLTSTTFTTANKKAQQGLLELNIDYLKSSDDQEAIHLFDSIERDINQDQYIHKTITFNLPYVNTELLSSYIKRKYLNGYLSKYEFQGFYYLNNQELKRYTNDKIGEYREKVINSTKISSNSNFYRYSTEIGTLEYFAILNLPLSPENELTLILNFSNKAFSPTLPFPLILNINNSEHASQLNLNKSSYAFYKSGALVTQNGAYIYPNTDNSYPNTLNQYISLDEDQGYQHVLFKPNETTTIVVSKKKQSYWEFIAIASLSFLVLYLFTAFINIVYTSIDLFKSKKLTYRILLYRIYRIRSEIQYSTRIQNLVITSVLFAVIISGIITFVSISYQSDKNRQAAKLEYISKIANKIESSVYNNNNKTAVNHIERLIKDVSEILVTDFNLYNNQGKLIYTTQPKIYDQKLISQYIHSEALLNLNVLKKNEILNKESVGGFKYDVSYATVRNANYQTLAYLSIPYFTSNDEDIVNQNTLLNTILNIYTIIIILFAFLSVFIANKITQPLKFIGQKIAETAVSGKSIEPLYWDRNDEIGTLIKEYNQMLLKLEENALQLRNKERETTWREMAQQVAHEIKNPLTPMKLGIQQLSRSFYENDPRLEERFQKISNSFIEQIDALSHIASEFSSFAKLPETKLTTINLIEKIAKSIDTYNNNLHTTILVTNNSKRRPILLLGDKGQLLRTFNNLVKNAIEAGGKRRKLKIDIIINDIEGEYIEIQIKDNGYGIPEEAMANIFRPSFTTKSSGMGLGLAFVKQTIESMNGQIRFETTINLGTTFFIVLPIYREGQDIS